MRTNIKLKNIRPRVLTNTRRRVMTANKLLRTEVGREASVFSKDTLVSIVMSYFDRKPQLLNTLDSIAKTQHHNVEVIICDDASPVPLVIDRNYRFPIKIIRIAPNNKWWVNPCIPINKAIEAATGELIIIQNPECYHVGDIVDHAIKNITFGKYYVYPCLYVDNFTNLDSAIVDPDSKWYHHPRLNPTYYHFTSAITAKDLNKLKGFSDIFASGIGWDDNEFLARVRQSLIVVGVTNSPFVKHQQHELVYVGSKPLFYLNKLLFDEIIQKGGPKVDAHTGYDWYTHIPVLSAVLDQYFPDVAIEFGSGYGSTGLLYNRVNQLVTVENDVNWFAEIANKYPLKDGFKRFLHYLGDNVTIATQNVADNTEITNYYNKLIADLPTGKCRLLFIDQFSCCRHLALAFYKLFDIIIFHDCEPAGWDYYNYGSVSIDDTYHKLVLKSPSSWTGLLISKNLTHDVSNLAVTVQPYINEFVTKYGLDKNDFKLESL